MNEPSNVEEAPRLVTYKVRSLDIWGHVPADCISHRCDCVSVVETDGDDEVTHNDDACDCHQDCNQSFDAGSFEVNEGATDAEIIEAMIQADYLNIIARTQCDVSHDTWPTLEVSDKQGRRVFDIELEGAEL